MQQFFRRYVGCIVVLGMVLGGIVALGHIVRPLDTDGAYSQIESFHSLPENSLEVILYGSSHTYRGVSAMELYESYGIGAYNYGWNWQKINTITLFLKDSLLTQKPKVVLVDTYTCNEVLKDVDIGPEIYYSRYIHDKTAQREYMEQCFGKDINRYLSYYVPLIPFHDNWNSITRSSFLPLRSNTAHLSTMGFSATDQVEACTIPDPAKFSQKELSSDAIAELDKIVTICRERDIEPVFFTVPHAHEYPYGKAMEEFCRSRGCVYLNLFDYLDDMGFDETTDFSDYSHLNTSGATKVAAFLGDFLVNNYTLTDMRTVEGNVWQRMLDAG